MGKARMATASAKPRLGRLRLAVISVSHIDQMAKRNGERVHASASATCDGHHKKIAQNKPNTM
jgi:hypothetical protein